MSQLHSYYEILGIKLDASLQEIKKAYRNLVKVWHPVIQGTCPLTDSNSGESFNLNPVILLILKILIFN